MTRNGSAVILTALFIAMLSSVPLLADDSAMSGIGGGAVAPMVSHPSVRMVNETVSVKLTDKGAKVRCEFLFRNEGSKCMVKMGFPENAWASGDGDIGRLSGFRSWVDGKPVKCVRKQGKAVETRGFYRAASESWYVKEVPFSSGQTRTIVNEYSTALGYSCYSMMTPYETPLDFTYILRTGRNWKGPIGKAMITVDVSGVPADHYELDCRPPGSAVGKHTISWNLSNFEPKDDISINLIPRFPKLNGKMIEDRDWSPFTRVRGVTMTGVAFLRNLGADIEYPEKHGVLVIKYDRHILRLNPGSKTADLDGSKIRLQAAASTGYYPVQIPTASVVRALGGRAQYSQKEHRLLIWLKNHSLGKR